MNSFQEKIKKKKLIKIQKWARKIEEERRIQIVSIELWMAEEVIMSKSSPRQFISVSYGLKL